MPAHLTLPVYVISLDRSAERYSSFLARNAHLGEVTRASAVDGKTLDRGDLLARGVLHPDAGYSDAALGCALSHACVWQIAAAADGPSTVAEDDAVFRRDFATAAASVIAGLGPDWDLVLWGWNFNSILCLELLPGTAPCALVGDQVQLRQNIARFQGSILPVLPIKLLRNCLPIRPADVFFPVVDRVTANDGIDMMMSLAYPQMQAYVSFPPLVVTEHLRETSTVQGRD